MTPKALWGGLLLAASFTGTSHAAIVSGNSDPVTGQNWIQAGSLAEGLALGYHAASTAEFAAYLSNSGFGTPSSTQEVFSRTVKPLLGFKADVYVPTDMVYEYGSPGITMGWLDGRTDQVGALLYTTGTQRVECPGSYSYNCAKTIYVNEAAFGTLAEMKAGQHDRYAYAAGGDWTSALAALPKGANGSPQLAYFMTTAVPEPSTWAMMGFGLLAVGSLARARRSKQT